MSNAEKAIKKERKGDRLENLVKTSFPKILEELGFEIHEIRCPSSRTNDITDVHKLEFELTEEIKEEIDGKVVVKRKETVFNWAFECKDKESKNDEIPKIRDQNLLYKIPQIEVDLPNVETWIILAPKSRIKDKSSRIIEKCNEEKRQFYIDVWDIDNNEFKMFFAVLGEEIWKMFFDEDFPARVDKKKLKKYIITIAQKGKKKAQRI